MQHTEPTHGVIGMGTVGTAIARIWIPSRTVLTHDKEKPGYGEFEKAGTADIVHACVPEGEDGDNVRTVLRLLRELDTSDRVREREFVIHSTVPIGFCDGVCNPDDGLNRVIHSPEFLTERCAISDVMCPATIILGLPWRYDNAHLPRTPQSLEDSLYYRELAERFPGTPIHTDMSVCTETAKLALNSFYSVKVAFFNEVASLCQEYKNGGGAWLNYTAVRALMLSQGTITRDHTEVPGPDGKFGFGGKCLPKDLKEFQSELVRCAKASYVSRAATYTNQMMRDLNADD